MQALHCGTRCPHPFVQICFKFKILGLFQIFVTDSSTTCSQKCLQEGLICEPHFFPDINQRSKFKMLDITCESFESPTNREEEIDYPAFKDGK